MIKKRISALLAGAAACLLLLQPMSCFAAGWVAPGEDTYAEAAIVIDADSGAVLWGKNIHEQYYPASITKLMTALVVLENCQMDEMAEVTSEAVSHLESGAVSVGLSVGDKLTVEDLLYAMLLRSANDAANVLAVHVSGSIDAFAELMTSRAAELGCRNTIFRNPSGLTTPENFTTAYDMALIGQACYNTPEFLTIEESLHHRIGGTAKNPDGFTVYAEHKMIVPGSGYTDKRVVGGKTGFIKASGNTLVTMAEADGRRQVAVVLKDKTPHHYTDTKMMLNFGFNNFVDLTIEDPAAEYGAVERLEADKIAVGKDSNIISYGPAHLTLPAGYDPEAITVSFEYNMETGAPENAVAKIVFRYADVKVGSAYVINDRESSIVIEQVEEKEEKEKTQLPVEVIAVITAVVMGVLIIGTIVFLILNGRRKEKNRREQVLERRRRRLEELNVSEEEFGAMLENRRNRKKES